jgi:predicted Zn-dependent protease
MAGSKKLYCLASLMIASLVAGAPAAESATVELMGYGWSKKEVTVNIKAGGAITEEAIADVMAAIEDWNLVLEEIDGPFLNVVFDAHDADIIIQLKVGGGPILGYTLVKATKGYSCLLEKASIHISSKAFGSKLSNAGTRNVARHELGHALGLGHSDDAEDVMFFAMPSPEVWGDQEKSITDNDAAALDAIYPLPEFCELPESVTTGHSTLYVAETASGNHFSGERTSPGLEDE